MRDVEGAGPHITFLRLKELWHEHSNHFEKALILFAKRYGLLGAFEEDYQQHPVFPEGQMLVAPEAVIDGEGRLRRVDPSTEGKELLLDLLEPKGWLWFFDKTDRKEKHSFISLPSDIRFTAKHPNLDSFWWPRGEPRQLATWEEIKQGFRGDPGPGRESLQGGIRSLYPRTAPPMDREPPAVSRR